MLHKYVITVGLAVALLGLASPAVFAQSPNVPVTTGVVATITAIDANTSMATLQTQAGEVFELPQRSQWHMGHKVLCDRINGPRPRVQNCKLWESAHEAGDAATRREPQLSSK